MPSAEKLLTTRDVAALFDVSIASVSSWIRRGWLVPSIRTPGGISKFTQSAVNEFADKYRPPPPAQPAGVAETA